MANRRTESGASLPGCLGVLVVGSLILTLSIPLSLRLHAKGVADGILERVDQVAEAAERYRTLHGEWPPSSRFGAAPGEIRGDLPLELRFTFSGGRMAWHAFPLPEGLPRHPELRALAGVAVEVDSGRVGRALAVRAQHEGRPFYRMGEVYTFLLEGP